MEILDFTRRTKRQGPKNADACIILFLSVNYVRLHDVVYHVVVKKLKWRTTANYGSFDFKCTGHTQSTVLKLQWKRFHLCGAYLTTAYATYY